MRKVFVISWFFPPVNAAEGIVTFKLLKNSKFSYDVFTQKKNDKYAFKLDKKLKSNNINVIYSNKKEVKDWINEGVEIYTKNKEEYNCIMSRCMPSASHELALKIKKKNKDVFWIASFSDPLAYSPYTKLIEEKKPYKDEPFSIKKIIKGSIWNLRRLRYRLFSDPERKNKKIQKETLLKADKVIFNNVFQKEFILSKYKFDIEEKIEIISHSFDEDFYYEQKKITNNKIILSFLGHLDNFRNASKFLEAVNLLKENKKTLYNKFEVRFYGNLGDKDKLYIMDNELYDNVKLFKPVTYFESLNIMKQSDYLLSIDADLKEYIDSNIFLASKIIDYIGSKTPIFGVTMDKGISKKVLEENNSLVSNFDVNNIYEKLVLMLTSKNEKNKKNDISKFNAKNVSKKFDEIIINIGK